MKINEAPKDGGLLGKRGTNKSAVYAELEKALDNASVGKAFRIQCEDAKVIAVSRWLGDIAKQRGYTIDKQGSSDDGIVDVVRLS